MNHHKNSVPAFAEVWLSEWRVDVELVAAGVPMRPRVRILGTHDVVVTLPADQWLRGRLLAGLTPHAMLLLTQAIIVSVPLATGCETWLLDRTGPKGLRTRVEIKPVFNVLDTVELSRIEDAPSLVQRFAWVCLRQPLEVCRYGLAMADAALVEQPECFRQIGWSEHPEAHA